MAEKYAEGVCENFAPKAHRLGNFPQWGVPSRCVTKFIAIIVVVNKHRFEIQVAREALDHRVDLLLCDCKFWPRAKVSAKAKKEGDVERQVFAARICQVVTSHVVWLVEVKPAGELSKA